VKNRRRLETFHVSNEFRQQTKKIFGAEIESFFNHFNGAQSLGETNLELCCI
jgi:hypothetical protein